MPDERVRRGLDKIRCRHCAEKIRFMGNVLCDDCLKREMLGTYSITCRQCGNKFKSPVFEVDDCRMCKQEVNVCRQLDQIQEKSR